jgi:hypothetical protein
LNSPVPRCYYSHETDDFEKKKRKFKYKKFIDVENYLHKNKFSYKRKNREPVAGLGLDDFYDIIRITTTMIIVNKNISRIQMYNKYTRFLLNDNGRELIVLLEGFL